MSDKGQSEAEASLKPVSAKPSIESQDDQLIDELLEKDQDQKELHKKLKLIKDVDNKKNLASHVKKVFSILIDSYPQDALERLEEVSAMVKNQENQPLNLGGYRDYKAAAKNYVDHVGGGKEEAKKENEEDEEANEQAEPEEVQPIGFCQDLMKDMNLLAWAGIGFGQQETYQLQMNLKKLASESSATNLSFFGKIRGTVSDYYIVEATVEREEGEGKEGMEAPGTGVNKSVFYVAKDSKSAWTKLPDLSPAEITAARKIRMLFTGDLTRKIICNPFFFGTEADYLRAQISRIQHSTAIIPNGVMRLTEENPKEIEENVGEDGQEVVMPSTADMARADMWVHANQNILLNSRTQHLDPEAPDDASNFDPEVAMKQLEEKDPYEPRLKPITDDKRIQTFGKATTDPWVIRFQGDKTEYASATGNTSVYNGAVVVKSLTWPGAQVIYQNGQQLNIYCGNGLKYDQKSNPFPLCPPKLADEAEEYEVCPEPNPKEKPAPAQPAEDANENEEN